MSLLTTVVPGLGDKDADAGRSTGAETPNRLAALLERAEPLGTKWAEKYDTAWALEENIRRDARAWSAETARETVRHLRSPQPSLAVMAGAVIGVGTANLVTTVLVLERVGVAAAAVLAAAGVLVSLIGMQLAARYIGIVAQHRAGIPPFRLRLQQELERQANAALDRRRERIAGPRRPIPRHAFSDLLPLQAHNIAAGWMRHLGELDATVLKPDETSDKAPMLLAEQAHLISSGYVGRVWSFAAETPELELALLEDAATATGKRPLLFSLCGFSDAVIARANRRGIGLLTYGPWNGTLVAHGTHGDRYLRRGLRDADGMTT
jgi:hypothetical protein